ncbi:AMP-binding protein [Nocardia terpenica]|uniref:AMP-binding protein n=1 Tax=Nocardia terpenica TaxID=455432 RepID=UPI0018950954|nr:AMP-binding protein [Nocardia terpenica]MBF6061544.1 AMP-binding protein [Nocardia terpenica]MBF6105227.1 AMP-binding protein [Nocardia terpenica]MBF6113303.1 AMP-binding protein [Nocardia terpenica]MBF6119433.1 AMP-binding protein [Nocardia terpenica]MBF6153081.1 AMP-binding protein [Nocardia terpenica]
MNTDTNTTEHQNGRDADSVAVVRGWLAHPSTDTGIYLADEADGWDYRSYAELADLTWSVAALLRERGLTGGDGACVIMPTGFSCVAAFYAVWACGGVFTPVAPPMFGDLSQYVEHVAAILTQAAPRLVVTSPEFEPLVRQAMTTAGRADEPVVIGAGSPTELAAGGRVFADPAECALLQFTSGSTGTPRGVRVSWPNLAANIAMITGLIEWVPGEAMMSWLPLYHDMGLVGAFLTTVANQADLYLMRPDQFVRDPVRWLRAMTVARHAPSPSFALGYVAHRVTPDQIQGLDLSGWRTLAVGSEPVEVADLRAFAELTGPQGFSADAYTLAYGLAEATLMVTSSTRHRPVTALRLDTGSLRFGHPIRVTAEAALGDGRWVDGPGWITGLGYSTPQSRVRVVDEHGHDLPDGTLGEMVVTGDSVALGYTTSSHTGSGTRIENDDLFTGDAGFLYRGEVFVLGRMGTSLKVRGRSVFMEDLESRIARDTGITKGKLAAVALTDAGAQGVALFAETAPGDWISEARRIIRGELGPAQVVTIVTGPRGFIRRTSSGKPRRRHMWQLYRDNSLDGAVVHDTDDLEHATGTDKPELPDRLHEWLDRALAMVAVPPESAVLFEGSLAEGFGNDGSDIDFLLVAPGDEQLPTLPTVLFLDGRRIEIRTRSRTQLRHQLDQVARGEVDEDLLNRCQRFLHATILRSGSETLDLDGLRELLPRTAFAGVVAGWWAERARHALRYAVALHALGEHDEAGAWARDGLLQAVKAWLAEHGETYLETKWLPHQLNRLAAARPDTAALIGRYRSLDESADLATILALAVGFGVEVADDPDQILLTRVAKVTTWAVGDRVHVLRDDHDVFALSDRAAHAWRSVVVRRSLRDILTRTTIGPELAEFIRLGLVGLAWRDAGAITPALAMCKPLRPHTPPPCPIAPAIELTGAARGDAAVVLSPLPADRFIACASELVWANVVVENAREDLAGAVKSGQGAVADIAAHRVIAMSVRMLLSAHGIHPLPANTTPTATLRRLVPATHPDLIAAVEQAGQVRFSPIPEVGDDALRKMAVLDDLLAQVRVVVGGTGFPASFDSREQWRRTLDISYDWLRIAGYLDTDLPLDEARDLLTTGGHQPHQGGSQ